MGQLSETAQAKLDYLREHIPNLCIDDNVATNGHVDALYYSFKGATTGGLPPETRALFEALFTAVEDGNYDIALEVNQLRQQNAELRAQLGYDVDVFSEYVEAS